ncbi:AMP-dependent synthetase [Clostridiaceae bacterium]|nr:AMP-dependent synthetase [Clostridiaceae bacterium]
MDTQIWDFEQFFDHIAVLDEHGNRMTYGELSEENNHFVEKIKERSLIFILCTNTIGSLIGYTGCIHNRIVPLLLPKNLNRELLDSLIDVYKPDYLWIPKELSLEFGDFSVEHEAFGYLLLETGYKQEYVLHDELCLLLTTSGSTGSPKLVRQSYKNVLSNAQSIVQYLELDALEKPITTLPMNYTYGLSIINSHLLAGATLLFTEKGLMQREFWQFFKEAAATSFGGVPYTYEMLDKLRFFKMELPSLRSMTQAGGKLQPELHKKFAEYAMEKGKRFYVMYGQSEATARMSYLPYEKSLEKYGSMGIAIPGGNFTLIDETGRKIQEPETVGELVYQGPNVTLGYAECGEDLKKGDERYGCLETGDMAWFDTDGYYYIAGRKKRFLKIFGNRVNLDEVERMIKGDFEGMDCVSTGRDDRMYVFVEGGALQEEIRSFLSEKTGLNPSAFVVKSIPMIPRNSSGKILYKDLEMYMKEP